MNTGNILTWVSMSIPVEQFSLIRIRSRPNIGSVLCENRVLLHVGLLQARRDELIPWAVFVTPNSH